jgi:alcohol dehydrogenase (cytochrome c)
MNARDSYFSFALCTAVLAAPAYAADWPQWQGPERNAVSKETGLLQEWPKNGPPLAWKVTGLGGGYNSPAIAAGRIYGMSFRGDDEVVWSRNETDGKQVWEAKLGPAQREGLPQGSEGPGCTPTVDGDRLYVIGAGGALACVQIADGKIVWQKNLIKDFKGRAPMWRYNESPLIDGDKLVCTPGGEDGTVIALNKATGDVVWKCQVPDPAGSGEMAQGRPGGPGGNRMPSAIRFMPALVALDADKNGEISTAEIDAAPTALATLDKNKDGKLSEEELSPQFPGRPGQEKGDQKKGQGGKRGPGGNMFRMVPAHAALDTDRSNDLNAAEIKNAAVALKSLDKNSDGKLTDEEMRPQFGGGQGGRGGGRGGFGGPQSGAGYSSAIAIDFEGQRQYVQLTAKTLVGVSAADGKLLWRYDRAANRMGINCSTPLYHDGVVFASSAYGSGGGAVKLIKESGGAIKAEEVYFSNRMQNHHGGMIVVDGALYGASGGNEGGMLACLDFKTGELLWRDRKGPKGSVAFADGRLYLRSEDEDIVLVEPNREKYVERGRFKQPDRSESPAWAHPVVANGKLYIRDQDLLLCYDLKLATR